MENDWVYDIEFYPNFFCVNFLKFPSSDQRITFEISERIDQRKELLEFLKQEDLRLIGFNNVGYDYSVLHILIEEPFISLLIWWKKIQTMVFQERRLIWDNKRHVFQIDLFKINHYDNPARSSSLKWLEFTRRWHRVQDLPHPPKEPLPLDMMDPMIEYCWNDVEFTADFALDCVNAIKFRENMSEVLGRNLMDHSDVKIGEYLNQLKYQELTGQKWKDFKDGRTYRNNFAVRDIIPECIKFYSKEMKGFLKTLRNTEFKGSDKKFRFDIVFDKNGIQEIVKGGITTKSGINDVKAVTDQHRRGKSVLTFAKGGLHTIEMPRTVNRKEGWVLVEKDVGSMYPRSIVVDGIYPNHLGEEWNQGIANAYNYRIDTLKPKLKELPYKSEEWQKVEDEQQVYKLAMNGGGFGKLGSQYSWQYDPLAKYKVTMGCELKLLMLIEAFIMKDIEVVSVNTDGVVIHYHQSKQELVDKIHKWWEEKTDFLLEDTYYNKIVFSSVNDYIAVIVDPKTDEVQKIKYKGDFEIDKDPHKNNSQRIVPIALSEYFTKGIPIQEVIGNLGYIFQNGDREEQVSIYDYCIGRKKNSSCEYWVINKGIAEKLKDKVVRYYIRKQSGKKLMKKFIKGKKEGSLDAINKGFEVEVFMDYKKPEEVSEEGYQVDENYYKNECIKIIKDIESGTRIYERGCYVQGTLDL